MAEYRIPGEEGSVLDGLTLAGDILYISSGGTASNTVLNDVGSMVLYSGGTANNTTVNSGGYVSFNDSATGNDMTVNVGGYVGVYSTSLLTGLVENGGCVGTYWGNIKIVPNTFSDLVLENTGRYGYATVHSGTTALRTVLNGGGSMFVIGGLAVSTTLNAGGRIEVANGGTANNTVINESAVMYLISSGSSYTAALASGKASANDTTVSSGGTMYLWNGGAVANGINVASGGWLSISSGGTATGIVVEAGGKISFQIVPNTVAGGTSDGSAFLLSDGKASNLVATSDFYLNVSNGAAVYNPTADPGGVISIGKYSYGYDIVENGGNVIVDSTATATFASNSFSGVVVSGYKTVTVHSGTTAFDTTVGPSGNLIVYSSGSMNGATVSGFGPDSWNWYSGGSVVINPGGIADGTVTAQELGSVFILDGAVIADGLKLIEDGGAVIAQGNDMETAIATHFVANSFGGKSLVGSVTVHSGTTATDIIMKGGALHVFSGGSIGNVTMQTQSADYDYGSAVIHSGAVVESAFNTKDGYGYIFIESGGLVSGLSGHYDTIVSGTLIEAKNLDYWGYTVSSGGSLISASTEYGGINILAHGYAQDAVTGGSCTVYAGGVASNTTVSGYYGDLYLSGGTALGVTLKDASNYVVITDGGSATNVAVNNGHLTVYHGSATDFTLGEYGRVILAVTPQNYAKGKAYDGSEILLEDGKISGFDLLHGDILNIREGGSAEKFVASSGTVYVSQGGRLTSAVFAGIQDSNGRYYTGGVLSMCGGSADHITFSGGAELKMDWGSMSEIDVHSGASVQINNGLVETARVSGGGMVLYGYVEEELPRTSATGVELSAIEVTYTYEGETETETYTYQQGASLVVSSGAIAVNTVIGSCCQASIVGGSATGAVVSSGGTMRIEGPNEYYYDYRPAGSADDITVSSGGLVSVGSGATATNIKVEKGGLTALHLAAETYAQGTCDGKAFEAKDGEFTADLPVLENGFQIYVHSDGVLNLDKNTVIADGGYLFLYTDATVQGADEVRVDQGGCLYCGELTAAIRENGGCVLTSGPADGLTFTPNTFSDLTLAPGQSATVHSGTTASRIVLQGSTTEYYGAGMIIYNGGSAVDINLAGFLYVYSGGTVSNTTVRTSGFLDVYGTQLVKAVGDGAFANVTTLIDHASMCVSGNASAVSTTLKDSACLDVTDEASVNSTTVSGGSMYVNAYASAFDTVVLGGSMDVTNYGLASTVKLSGEKAALTVYNGGIAIDVSVENGGLVAIGYEGYVSGLTSVGGEVSVGCSGTLTGDTQVEDGGKVLMSGYSALLDGSATVKNGGKLSAGSGAVISAQLTVETGGEVTLGSSATLAGSTTVQVNGNIFVDSEAWISGPLTIEDGATVTMADGAGLDFDISAISEPAETALLNNYSAISGSPDLSITVSYYDQPHGTYILADNAAGFKGSFTVYYRYYDSHYQFDDPLSLDSGTIQYGDSFYSLTLSETNQLLLTVGEYIPDNGPDGGWNNEDKLWDKKAKKPVDDGIYYSDGTYLNYDVGTIQLDKPMTIRKTVTESDGEEVTYTNFVGKISEGFKPDTDASDCGKIVLNKGARLSLKVTGETAGKLVIYQIVETPDKKDPVKTNYSLKTVQTTKLSLKKNTSYCTISTKAVYLQKGTYYVSMQGTIAKRGDTEGFYNVEVNYNEEPKKPATHYYMDDDNNANDWLYEGGKKGRGLNSAVAGISARNLGRWNIGDRLNIDTSSVWYDPTGKYLNFVGFGDATDYRKVHIDTAANLSFTVESDCAVKLTIYQLTYDKNDNVNGAKALQSTTLKAGKGEVSSTLKLLQTSGDYYISVTSTNAKKGDSAYYNVYVNSRSVFYDNCDDNTNDWLYEGGKGGRGENTTLVESAGITLVDTLTNIQIDNSVPSGESGGWRNFVGFGDADDYRKLVVKKDGATAVFKVDAKDQAKFTIYSYDKATNKAKALHSSVLKKEGDLYTVTTAEYTFATAGEYYIAVNSPNAKKGGNAYYTVTLVSTNVTEADLLGDALAVDLAMPETASGLNLTDDLSFGQYGVDALADASAFSLAELDDKSAWQNLAKLA